MNFNDIIQSVAQSTYSAFFYTPSIYKNAISYLFLKPVEVISVYKEEDLKFSFNQIQKLIDKEYFAYSLINYEAGFLFEENLSSLQTKNDEKLIQFFFFDKKNVKELNSSKVVFDDFSIDKYSISEFKLNRSESEFNYDIAKIKAYIKAGDTYQVNYTLKGEFSFKGSYSSFFQKLLFNQSANYSAFINNNDKYIISLSPELFFHQKGKKIVSYPMKGTAQRGHNTNADTIAKTELEKSKKNLAENVMIVDLIRNDLGKICKYGSVKVPELFHIEKYESLFQMISVVKGKLRKKTKTLDILKNIFPCGSVTGAPKIRTMRIINEIEKDERGIYTGSISLITPDGIKMNVAIRTMTIDKNTGDGVIGLGSGIVWDSEPNNEYEEVLLKSKFLTEPLDYFEIFETMKYENGKILFFDEHLERMKSAADYFLFRFSEKKIRKQIEISVSNIDLRKSFKIKVTLSKFGDVNIIVSEIPKHKRNVSVIISQNKIISTDKFRHFKTTNRKLYDDEYLHFNSKGFYEVIYLNEKDEIAEGSRTNIFLRKDNSWFTPSLESGALPGIYRNYFIQNQNDIIEKSIIIDELIKADEMILTNVVRGETKVSRLFISPTEFISFNN